MSAMYEEGKPKDGPTSTIISGAENVNTGRGNTPPDPAERQEGEPVPRKKLLVVGTQEDAEKVKAYFSDHVIQQIPENIDEHELCQQISDGMQDHNVKGIVVRHSENASGMVEKLLQGKVSDPEKRLTPILYAGGGYAENLFTEMGNVVVGRDIDANTLGRFCEMLERVAIIGANSVYYTPDRLSSFSDPI